MTSPEKPQFLHSLAGLVVRNQETLWWLHSVYALLFGIGVMWLGYRNFAFLRVTLFYVLFIWITSLLLPRVLPKLGQRWGRWLQRVIHYFNRNFYQQILFFILPIYYASATLRSRNIGFVVLLAASALLSTLDVVYDRRLSARWNLAALFFAFNLFACVNVMLPVLWSISNLGALYISAVASFLAFATFCFRLSGLPLWKARALITAGGLFLMLFVFSGRAYVPPAPLRLLSAEFGSNFDRASRKVAGPLSAAPANAPVQIVGLTPIHAPLGLREQVSHQWYLDGIMVSGSPFYQVTGGRREGFRLWTSQVFNLSSSSVIRLDVVTEGGQLIGRAWLPVSR
ncbi:MAG: DUF5924 family protein [Acidobacteria bacterium]|nr:DUF5924 family protein [Acidobacteriota bacterium]MCI0720526.1 DUF5924 family protein [Acidobacteriota bacterium]